MYVTLIKCVIYCTRYTIFIKLGDDRAYEVTDCDILNYDSLHTDVLQHWKLNATRYYVIESIRGYDTTKAITKAMQCYMFLGHPDVSPWGNCMMSQLSESKAVYGIPMHG